MGLCASSFLSSRQGTNLAASNVWALRRVLYLVDRLLEKKELWSLALGSTGSIRISHRDRSILSDLGNPCLAGAFERSILKSPVCFLFANLVLETAGGIFRHDSCPCRVAGISELALRIVRVFLTWTLICPWYRRRVFAP